MDKPRKTDIASIDISYELDAARDEHHRRLPEVLGSSIFAYMRHGASEMFSFKGIAPIALAIIVMAR